MKLKPTILLRDFLSAVQKCRSDVYFTTTEGDSLNLKSKLSEYIFLAAASGDNKLFQNGSITCESQEDYLFLQNYIEI